MIAFDVSPAFISKSVSSLSHSLPSDSFSPSVVAFAISWVYFSLIAAFFCWNVPYSSRYSFIAFRASSNSSVSTCCSERIFFTYSFT